MQTRRTDDSNFSPAEPALRVIMRRLREIMSQAGDGQSRLDKIVRQIAGVMVAEVCSIYLKRQDGSLELYASEGLKPEAVHNTRLIRGEGLVGRCAVMGVIINEPEASSHPSFSYRPETGEEVYHSLLAVPVQRSGQLLGVLVVQNRTPKEYSDEDVEVLQSTAMIVAEQLVSGAVAGAGTAIEVSKSMSAVLSGAGVAEGIALGRVVLHEQRMVVTQLMADDPAEELVRLDTAINDLRASLDDMLGQDHLAASGEHRDVLEAFRMLAHDKGWKRRLNESVESGLTAEAAIERVQNATRLRMTRHNDPIFRERQRDLDDLSDRLMRILAGRAARGDGANLPNDAILVARTLGPAELLDYDRTKLRGLVIEDGSSQSHVAIVAKALGIAAVGQVIGIVDRVNAGDAIIVDAVGGEVHLRPGPEVIAAYTDKVRFRAKRQRQYDALRDLPAITRDGQRIALLMNAGLLVDMTHFAQSGADGIGLFRTELQFMLSDTLPRLERQLATYRAVVTEAGTKPVVFRALDIGGDKVLPYLRQVEEENPAMGWRAIRMSLDRPALFRTQVRAFLRAAAGRELSIMIPMVSEAREMTAIRALIDKEYEIMKQRRAHDAPSRVRVGAMLEVPSLLFELDQLMPRVDFISVGSNDLLQFMFAADRTNARVGSRYDSLSVAPLRALKTLIEAGREYGVPVTLCGEMAGRPLEAMALIGLGFRSISMAPASIGPVKTMILSLNGRKIEAFLNQRLEAADPNLRQSLMRFAEEEEVEI